MFRIRMCNLSIERKLGLPLSHTLASTFIQWVIFIDISKQANGGGLGGGHGSESFYM